MKQTLNTLPRTLDETYDRMLLNIDRTYHKEALSALMWLLFSERPLSLSELAEAMVINDSAEPAFNPSDRLFSPESALTILSSLVTTTRRGYNESVIEVDHAHYSVKEYLTSKRASEGPAACLAILHTVAQEHIVRGCLHYMKHWGPCDPFTYSKHKGPRDLYNFGHHPEGPLLGYAATSWSFHAKECGEHMTEVTMQMIVDILGKPQLWARYSKPEWWISKSESLAEWYYKRGIPNLDSLSKSSDSHSALYYAACLGLNEIVQYLLRQDSPVNEEVGLFGNALQAASLRSQVSTVMTLVQGGAKVNQRGGLFGSAINAACFAGNLQIVEYLINSGACVEYEAL